MKKKILTFALVAGLTMGLVACTAPAWVVSAENFALVGAAIASQVIDVADPAIAPLANEVDAVLNILVKALQQYQASPTATNLQAVQSAIDAAQSNEAALETALRLDPKQDQIVDLVVGGLDDVINSLVATIPPAAQAKLHLRLSAKPGHVYATPDEAKAAFNRVTRNDHRFQPLR